MYRWGPKHVKLTYVLNKTYSLRPHCISCWTIYVLQDGTRSLQCKTFKSVTLNLNNYVSWSTIVVKTCKVCETLSFSWYVFIIFHVTRRKSVSKLFDHPIATFPFQAILQFYTLWFVVIKIMSYNIGLRLYRTSLYKGVPNLSRMWRVFLLIIGRKKLICVLNYVIDYTAYICMGKSLCDLYIKGRF